MPIFSKDSLENLRSRIDLVEVLSSHIELKPAGAAYKALCPFHDEKTPSFTIQKGDGHYHCYGCGAHGDAIQFLMTYLKMSFLEAVESLAQKFQVHLEQVEGSNETKGPNKAKLKEALNHAMRFYHFMLLHTEEGHRALRYLYRRGIDLKFIHQFHIGLAPANTTIFRKFMEEKGVSTYFMQEAGLITHHQRDFFSDRITFPIQNASGACVGFSARKYKEETFGGKYINTPETALFKKSKLLYGLNFCRRRIAKERKAIIVEGQIDTLRLIYSGLNFTVAAQGTAFGAGHVKELASLGVNHVYLALDADKAGEEAACKIGDLLQKEGIAVSIVSLPEGSDPDVFLREEGLEAFTQLLDSSEEFLPFLIEVHAKTINIDTPAGKSELVQKLSQQIRRWDHPLMVHESLRKLAHLTKVPEDVIGVGQTEVSNIYIKKSASAGHHNVDPNRILECDLLRWLLLTNETHPQFLDIAKEHLTLEHFQTPACQKLYETYLEHTATEKPCDLLSIAISLDDTEGQLMMSDLLQKKVDKERAVQYFQETVQKMLDRHWMQQRELVKMKIQSGKCSDDEVMELVKQFDTLKKAPPQVSVAVN